MPRMTTIARSLDQDMLRASGVLASSLWRAMEDVTRRGRRPAIQGAALRRSCASGRRATGPSASEGSSRLLETCPRGPTGATPCRR